MVTVTWAKPVSGYYGWDGDVASVATVGVYVIWYYGNPGRVVRLGQGKIADRIAAHRRDAQITRYRPNRLLITWAAVPPAMMDGVERYLSERYPPLVGD